MSTKPQRLKKVIDDLRQIIVGQVAMPHDQIDQITLFIFIKQLSRMNDDLVRLGSKEIIFTGQYERYHYDVLSCLSGEELVKECRLAIESLYTNTAIEPTIRKLFERSYLKIMDSKVLGRFLAELTRSITDDMDMGDFYESLLPILGTQNELGQFRTPRHIIDFMVQMIDPKIGETICDPACGTAGFLISAFKFLCNKYSDEKGNLSLNPAQLKQLYTSTIFGWDIEPLMVKFSLANLYLHGLKNPNVAGNDTLLNENLWMGSDDIIIANPPFITPKGGAARHARFTNKSNKTEVLFLEWMIHHLNYNGRMGVIVPEGIIFDSSKGHTEIRKQMINSGLWCVVSLPANVFQPYSGVKTSILFLDKAMQCDKVLFCKIDNHGYSLNTNPSPIEKNDLPNVAKQAEAYKQAVMMHKEYEVPEKGVILVEKAKLSESGYYNLNGERYGVTHSHNSEYPFVELGVVCDLYQPVTISAKEMIANGEYHVFGANGIIGKYNQYNHIGEEVVVTCRGATCGTVNMTLPKSWITGNAMVAHPKTTDLNKKFLFYLLSNSDLTSTITGSAQPQITRASLTPYRIPLPPLSVQEEIVVELDSYQKIIDGAKQVVDNWKPRIDIDPEWDTVRLDAITELITKGSTPTTYGYKFQNEGINFVKIESLSAQGVIENTKLSYVTRECHNSFARSQLQVNDILFSIAGTKMGISAIVPETVLPANTNQALAIIRLSNSINHLFVLYCLRSSRVMQEMEASKTGVAQFNLSLKQVSELTIPYPAPAIQQAIVERIAGEQKLVDGNRELIKLYEHKIKERIDKLWKS
jgi:type I restriction enzyme M protein